MNENETTRRTEEHDMTEQDMHEHDAAETTKAEQADAQQDEESMPRPRINRRRFPDGPPSIADVLAKPASWAVHEMSRVLSELAEIVEEQQRQLRQARSVLQATERARTLPPALAGRVREAIEDVEATVVRVGSRLAGRSGDVGEEGAGQ